MFSTKRCVQYIISVILWIHTSTILWRMSDVYYCLLCKYVRYPSYQNKEYKKTTKIAIDIRRKEQDMKADEHRLAGQTSQEIILKIIMLVPIYKYQL